MKKRSAIVLFLIVAIIMAGARHARAQYSSNDIALTLSPEFPEPNQTVYASISSFSVDLSRASTGWYIDGKLVQSGVDKKTFTFTSPPSGRTATLSIIIITSDGARIEKKETIASSELDILWEAPDSYVPPFYRGKALPAPEAVIKVVAVPSGGAEPENLVYSWRRGFKNIPDASGYGKQAFAFRNSYLSTVEEIEVTATSVDRSYAAQKQLRLNTVPPKVIVYQDDPERGVLRNEAFSSSRPISAQELILVAEPYYFSPRDAASRQLSYQWVVDGARTSSYGKSNAVRIPNTRKKTAVSLVLENVAMLFQNAEREISIDFR